MSQLELRDILLFGAPLGASALSLALMHWLPWKDGVQNLERTTAYALGTTVTVGYPMGTMLLAHALGLPQNELFWAALLFCNTAVSGITVNVAYWIDSKRPITLDEAANNVSGT